MKFNTRHPNTRVSLRVLFIALLMALIAGAGCSDTGPTNAQYFSKDDARSIDSTLERQKASGAQQDAMLRDQHFDGASLNSLGRAKLDRMLAKPGPVTVYLDGPKVADRHEAVLAFAADHRRPATDIKIVDGPNPGTLHLASYDLPPAKSDSAAPADESASTSAPAASSTAQNAMSK